MQRTHRCPKCNQFGVVWDGRAKGLMCYFDNCNFFLDTTTIKELEGEPSNKAAILLLLHETNKQNEKI